MIVSFRFDRRGEQPSVILVIDIVATESQRLFSRVLQVFETQRVDIRSFTGEVREREVGITVVCVLDPSRAYRLEALLNRLENVRGVTCRAVIPLESATSADELEELAQRRVNRMSPVP